MKRDLLLRAPPPEALDGLVLDASDRSVREQIRRASVKLERVGLVERVRMQSYVRARDPRRASLLFVEGCFYRHTDRSRAHAVRRNVIWQSAFGAEILLRYRPQLQAGMAIRWDARTVKRAQAQAAEHWIDRGARHVQVAFREEVERDAVILADVAARKWEVVVPDEVLTERDRERWELAVAVAHDRDPQRDVGDLWEAARGLYATMDQATLMAAAAEIPRAEQRRPSRAEVFRRRRQSLLSRSLSD
jgi:hypothetical protein